MEKKVDNRPLTKRQKEFLMECHESEILKQDLTLGPQDMRSVKRLFKKGLVSPRNVIRDGKVFSRFYITNLGKRYLEILNVQN